MKQKKQIIAILLMTSSVLFCSCSKSTDVTLEYGNYILEDAIDLVPPCVLIQEDHTFEFTFSGYSSYIAIGTYEIQNSELILTTEDEEANEYVFTIDEDMLIFNEDKSSEIPTFENSDTIQDGDIFISTQDN